MTSFMTLLLIQAPKIPPLTSCLKAAPLIAWNRQLHSSPLSQSSSCPDHLALTQVPRLSSWDPQLFQSTAYAQGLPFRFPRCDSLLPPACSRWFTHQFPSQNLAATATTTTPEHLPRQPRAGDHVDVNKPPHGDHATPSSSSSSSELDPSFWANYQDALVSLELTSHDASGRQDFHQVEAPLGILLSYLSNTTTTTTIDDTRSPPSSPSPTGQDLPHSSTSPSSSPEHHSIYLAQCSLADLPPALQLDLPTPSLLTTTASSNSHDPAPPTRIRGDIYASSLWLGRPPTYTPLHRDPNPNLFIQLAGSKVIRLLPPAVGDAIFQDVHTQVSSSSSPSSSSASSSSSSSSSPRIRGEEMMQGPQRSLLHRAIWPDYPDHLPWPGSRSSSSTTSSDPKLSSAPPSIHESPYSDILQRYAQEITVHMGDALFIPTGWWHSVKGTGAGVTASANWWFR